LGQFCDCHLSWRHPVGHGIRTSLRVVSIFLCFGSILPAHATESVGVVTKVVNEAQIDGAAATAGAPIRMSDRLRTGANARLQVTFRDNSVLTLGEKANVLVDRYVFNPERSKGEILLSATQGAFRFAGGKLKQMSDKKITVKTPVAALAVRGTEFWAGPIDGQYGVLLLKGKLAVSNRAGAVRLSRPGMGTDIALRGRAGRKARL
jgi:hypothetical protein